MLMMMVRDRLVTITRAVRPANTHRKPRITITARRGAAGLLLRLLPREELAKVSVSFRRALAT